MKRHIIAFPFAFLPLICFLDTMSTYLKHQLLGGYLDLGTSDRIYCQDNSSYPYSIYTTGAFLIYIHYSLVLSQCYTVSKFCGQGLCGSYALSRCLNNSNMRRIEDQEHDTKTWGFDSVWLLGLSKNKKLV